MARTNRYVIAAALFLVLAFGVIGMLLIRQSEATLLSLINRQMLDITDTAADMLDGDALETLRAEDAGSPAYQSVLKTLRHFQKNIDLEYIYCVYDRGEQGFVFGVDPSEDKAAPFGSPVVSTPALIQASKGEHAVDGKAYTDEWGRFYSAYSPVFNSRGQVAGIVAVDFNADWYDAQTHGLLRTFLVVAALALVLGGALVAAATGHLRSRVRQLYDRLNTLSDFVQELLAELNKNALPHMGEKAARREASIGEDDIGEDDIETLGNKIQSMQEELREEIEIIQALAFKDGLSGLGNKSAYLEEVKHLEKRIGEQTAAFSLAIFDLNGLKAINDDCGHANGDLALIDTARLLQKVYRREDLYRVGGDEFVALMDDHSEEELAAQFEALDRELELANRVTRPYRIPLSVSKGCAAYRPGEDADFAAVFNRADQQMYVDKAAYYKIHGDRRSRPV